MNVTECWPYFCGISPLFVEVLRLFKFEFIIMPRLSSRTDLSNITKKIGIKIMQIRVLCIWVNLFFFFWNILLSNSQMLFCVACNKHLTFCKIILRRFSFLKSLKIDAKKTQQTKNLEIAKKNPEWIKYFAAGRKHCTNTCLTPRKLCITLPSWIPFNYYRFPSLFAGVTFQKYVNSKTANGN